MEAKHAQSDDDLLAVTPAAAIIGVHPQTLRNYETQGLIRCFRTPGRNRRFRRGDLIAFRNTPPIPKPPVDSLVESQGAFSVGGAA